MSNRPKPQAKSQSSGQRIPGYTTNTPAGDGGSKAKLLAIGAAVAVVIAAVVLAVVLKGGGDDTAGDDATIVETSAVKVTGANLPPFPKSEKPVATLQEDSARGQVAPTLDGFTPQGDKISYGPGKKRLLVFVAHWCPHCQAEIPRIVQWVGEGAVPKDVELSLVSTGVDQSKPNFPPSKWLTKAKFPGDIMVDSEAGTAANAYGLQSFPYLLAIDAEGKVMARGAGELTRDEFDSMVTLLGPA